MERFPSKQQRLAVKMWEYIKEQISKDDARKITLLKKEFAEKNGIAGQWSHDCWLCENAQQNCCDCLLRTCKEWESTYGTVVDLYASKQERLKACDTIIKAVKDTDQYYVLEDNRLTTVPGDREFKFTGTLKACLAFVRQMVCIKGGGCNGRVSKQTAEIGC